MREWKLLISMCGFLELLGSVFLEAIFEDAVELTTLRQPTPGCLRSGLSCRGLTSGFLLLCIFSVGISVSPHVCFILDLILISMFIR